MGQRHPSDNALEKEVTRLRSEIEQRRSQLNSDVLQLKSRLRFDPHTVMEKSVQLVAGSAGTVIGNALAFSRRLFAPRNDRHRS